MWDVLSTQVSKSPLKYKIITKISIKIIFDNFSIEYNNDMDNKKILRKEHPILRWFG